MDALNRSREFLGSIPAFQFDPGAPGVCLSFEPYVNPLSAIIGFGTGVSGEE